MVSRSGRKHSASADPSDKKAESRDEHYGQESVCGSFVSGDNVNTQWAQHRVDVCFGREQLPVVLTATSSKVVARMKTFSRAYQAIWNGQRAQSGTIGAVCGSIGNLTIAAHVSV